jgi:adenosylhomocysteine nucleosidase
MDMSRQPSAISDQPSGKASGADGQGQGEGIRIGIIAAIREEIAPLVRGWSAQKINYGGREFELFESGDAEGYQAFAICSGIGAEHGRRATEALIQEARPAKILSVGYAGALDSALKVGDVVEPRTVVSGGDGSRTDTGAGEGVLVSYPEVADRDQKRRLGSAYGAIAVDMEGAPAAMAAQAHGIEFAALKAISDTVDFAMPPVQKFVGANGRFRKLAFGVHVSLRPWLWWRTMALARNSARASKSLCAAIEVYLNEVNIKSKGARASRPHDSRRVAGATKSL